MVPARELHLGLGRGRDLVDASAVTDSLNALPGFRSSAAFFTFLRANLVLPPASSSAMSSNTGTPILNPSSSQTLPPPSPSPLSNSTFSDFDADPLAGVPPLSTAVLTSSSDRVSALKLIADSIAQQRQTASRAIIFHPIFIAAWGALFTITYKLQYKERDDVGIWFTTFMGLTMALLVAVRGATAGYLGFAEEMKFEWLENEDGEEDILIGEKFGEEMVGALALRLERPGGAGLGSSKAKRGKTGGYKGGKGIIRAWTTKLRYRHKGVGTGLLIEALRVTREKCGSGAEVGFAADHANSRMVLPGVFNRGFRRGEERAVRQLEGVDEGGKKKR